MHAHTQICEFAAHCRDVRSDRCPCSANATVIIKTFQFSICVTGTKHPDACKNVDADAQVVVSDEKMESLDSKIGQAASIMAAPSKGGRIVPERWGPSSASPEGLGPATARTVKSRPGLTAPTPPPSGGDWAATFKERCRAGADWRCRALQRLTASRANRIVVAHALPRPPPRRSIRCRRAQSQRLDAKGSQKGRPRKKKDRLGGGL